jgi:hypothetical protein
MNSFVWTEVFNCGTLAQVLLPSYVKHHYLPIHVYGFPSDLSNLPGHDLIVPVPISDDPRVHVEHSRGLREDYLRAGYRFGHLGTARLWAYLIKTRPEKNLIHVDSDVIFLGDAVHDIEDALDRGSVLAGRRRMYRFNLNGRDDVRKRADCVDTYCFGFDRRAARARSNWGLVRQIRGQTIIGRMRGQRVIDFFDTVAFRVMKSGNVAYLDSSHSGSSSARNLNSVFSSKILEVRSAVGTGCAIFNGHGKLVPEPYRKYALESFSIFAYYLLGIETGIARPTPGDLEAKLLQIDRQSWSINSQ